MGRGRVPWWRSPWWSTAGLAERVTSRAWAWPLERATVLWASSMAGLALGVVVVPSSPSSRRWAGYCARSCTAIGVVVGLPPLASSCTRASIRRGHWWPSSPASSPCGARRGAAVEPLKLAVGPSSPRARDGEGSCSTAGVQLRQVMYTPAVRAETAPRHAQRALGARFLRTCPLDASGHATPGGGGWWARALLPRTRASMAVLS